MNHPPLCRWCGKPTRKRTRDVYFGNTFGEGENKHRYPMTKADVQALFNEEVVSVRYVDRGSVMEQKHGHYIMLASLWDGVSYTSELFCNGEHAQLFGIVMAKQGAHMGTTTYTEALAKQRRKVA